LRCNRSNESIDGLDGPLRLLAVVTEQHLEPVPLASKTASHEAPNFDAQRARARSSQACCRRDDNPAIAERLRLSDHTVKRHVANILLKLDLPTRAAAAALLDASAPVDDDRMK
jgi:hypothetical protein